MGRSCFTGLPRGGYIGSRVSAGSWGQPSHIGGAVNKALWICSLLGAALGISLGLALFHTPFWGLALGLGIGAVVGASMQRRH